MRAARHRRLLPSARALDPFSSQLPFAGNRSYVKNILFISFRVRPQRERGRQAERGLGGAIRIHYRSLAGLAG